MDNNQFQNNSTEPTIKKRRKRSEAWKHFEDIGGNIAKCLICKVIIPINGQTNGMLKHIRTEHKDSVNMERNKETICDSAEELLSLLIIKDGLCLSLLDKPNFRNFCGKLDPNFTIPSRRKFTSIMLPAIYIDLQNDIFQNMQRTSFMSFTTDTWTSSSNDSYMAITCHYIDDELNFKNFLLSVESFPEKHTALNIYEKFSQVLEKWNCQDKCVAVVHDSAPNMYKAMNDNFDNNLRCFGHTLQLCVLNSLKNMGIHTIILKIRSVVCHFSHSSTASNLLEVFQEKLFLPKHELIQEVITRWNSTYFMLERFIEQKAAIYAVLVDQNKQSLFVDITEDDILIISQLIKILKPYEEATKQISGENYVSASLILPIAFQLDKLLQKEQRKTSNHSIIASFLTDLNFNLQTMKTKYEIRKPLLGKCCFLDPRFKDLKFLSNQDKEDILRHIACEIEQCETSASSICQSVNPQTSILWEDYNGINVLDDETLRYSQLPTIRLNEDPLIFWNNNRKHFPSLHKLARKFLCIPGSSASSERVFSCAGFVADGFRNRLTRKNVEMLVFLRYNYKRNLK